MSLDYLCVNEAIFLDDGFSDLMIDAINLVQTQVKSYAGRKMLEIVRTTILNRFSVALVLNYFKKKSRSMIYFLDERKTH